MEVIRKTVNIDTFKSHVVGVIPSITFNESGDSAYTTTYESSSTKNYGNYICDFKIGNKVVRGCTYMRHYNMFMEIIRRAQKLMRQPDKNECITPSSNLNFVVITDVGITLDEFLSNVFEIYLESEFDEENVPSEINYIVLIPDDDAEEYTRMFAQNGYTDRNYGKYGYEYYKDAYGNIFEEFTFEPIDPSANTNPYIPIPVEFDCRYADIGLLSGYMDLFGEEGDELFLSGNTIEHFENIESKDLRGGVHTESSGDTKVTIVESKLETLRIPEFVSDDNGKVLQGVFEKFGSGDEMGQMNKCTYNNGEWTIEAVDVSGLTCADDEVVQPGEMKYRTLTVFETLTEYINSMGGAALENGDYFYFLIRYNNSEETPMDIPYRTGITFNTEINVDEYGNTTYTGDYIKSIVIDNEESEIYFTYVIGAVFTDDTFDINTATDGIVYEESYAYKAAVEGTFDIDGFENITYWYNSIDFETNKAQIYNSALNLTYDGNLSSISEIPLGDVWRMDGSVVNTYAFKEDYLMGMSFDSNIDLNVEINRGNAAAFEKHLRLSECNTMQDLEEIGNNFYNL